MPSGSALVCAHSAAAWALGELPEGGDGVGGSGEAGAALVGDGEPEPGREVSGRDCYSYSPLESWGSGGGANLAAVA